MLKRNGDVLYMKSGIPAKSENAAEIKPSLIMSWRLGGGMTPCSKEFFVEAGSELAIPSSSR